MASDWPPPGLSTPTVPHKDAISVTADSIRINAPAAKVFDALLDVGAYQQWNQFVPDVKIKSQPEGVDPAAAPRIHPGTLMIFDVVMDAKKPHSTTPTELRVSDISTPQAPSDYVRAAGLQDAAHGFHADLGSVYRVAWKSEGGFVSRGLRTERFHDVIVLGEEECEVRTWEIMGGVLAYTVKWMFSKTLKEKFTLWCTDLKRRCEE